MMQVLTNIVNWCGDKQIWDWLCSVTHQGDCSCEPANNITYIIAGIILVVVTAICIRRSWREKFF